MVSVMLCRFYRTAYHFGQDHRSAKDSDLRKQVSRGSFDLRFCARECYAPRVKSGGLAWVSFPRARAMTCHVPARAPKSGLTMIKV